MGRFFEVIPLTAFLILMRNSNPSSENYWLLTYGISALAAIGCISFNVFTHGFQNKIFLGINCYLISGAVGIIANLHWLMNLYNSLQSAAMLMWVMGIGIFALLFSSWFPVQLRQNARVRLYESCMTLLTIGAFGLAFSYPANRVLSETIPFFALLIIYYMLTFRLQSKQAIRTA